MDELSSRPAVFKSDDRRNEREGIDSLALFNVIQRPGSRQSICVVTVQQRNKGPTLLLDLPPCIIATSETTELFVNPTSSVCILQDGVPLVFRKCIPSLKPVALLLDFHQRYISWSAPPH
jgi:hypothetical protein